jgi:4,5-dihydroxyphthalate decarboxylase
VTPLTTAIGNYGLTRPMKQQGQQQPPAGRLALSYIEVEPIIAAMRRMCRGLEFDVCEMAFTTYLCARALGKPFTAIPVFVTRNFHHWAVFINAKSGIRTPKDLEGRVIGVNRGYTVTTGLWARGILQSEYGVDLDKITFVPTDDEHVAEFKAPPNVDYAKFRGRKLAELLEAGEIDAAIGDIGANSPDITPLIPDARNAGFDYFRRTGIYPLNHGIVIKDSVLKDAPWVADELFQAFKEAKASYLAKLKAGTDLTATERGHVELGNVVGGDPFPYGVEANRKGLEAMTQFAVEQHMVPRKFTVEELFVPSTLKL